MAPSWLTLKYRVRPDIEKLHQGESIRRGVV
jgi:hypothetical protein